jgi:hypothetical protein
MVGNMDRAALDAHQLGMFDLDRLDVMEFSRRRRFGHMHRAAAKRGAARCHGRQFCQCHPNRHDRCLCLQSLATTQVKLASKRVGHVSRLKQTQIALHRATQLTTF